MRGEVEALMLAGGRGKRMGVLTEDVQKCLLPIEGRPIIGHILDCLAATFGSLDLKIAVSYKADDVVEYVNKNTPNKTRVTYVHIPPGVDDFDAYQKAENHIHGAFLALPGDILIDSIAYAQVLEVLNKTKADVVTTLSPLVDIANTHPAVKINGLHVVEYLAKAPVQLDHDHLRDLMIFASSQKIFHYMRQYPNQGGYFGNVIQKVVENEQALLGVTHELPWMHFAYPDDLSKPFLF